VDADTALVGAPLDTHGGINYSGSVSVFTRSGTIWSEQDKLVLGGELDPHGRHLGVAVALEGDACLAGADHDDHSGGTWAGAAYVFTRTGARWAEDAKLTASDAWASDHFGRTVALSGTTAIAGAWDHDTAAGTGVGTAYGYRVLTSAFGAWLDSGEALAGVSGVPRLVGWGDLLAGAQVHLTLTHAKANGVATLVIGLSAINAPFKGGVMVPHPDVVLPDLPISATTKLELSATWPAGVPSGWDAWYQMWTADAAGPLGFSSSNAVQSTTP
jgi:hypothetical protein